MSDRPPFRSRPLWELTKTRVLAFVREPEAVFWTFGFPVLLALALGVAFRQQGPPKSAVGIERSPATARYVASLEASPDLDVVTLRSDSAQVALRRGKIAVLVRADSAGRPVLVYDPLRPETRLAQLTVLDVLERAAGRRDRLDVRSDTVVRPGSRYIDFLIPGLIGLNLLGTGFWGIGFPVATARQQKLLRRLIATLMRRRDYLLSLMLNRVVWLIPEIVVILGFGALAFGVTVRGSWTALTLVILLGTVAFSALGLLIASRAKTIEAVSGLMNFAMVPMWVLSGSFFTAARFPEAMQPFVKALPLTAANDALRAIMNEGAGLGGVGNELAVLAAWTVVSFALALRWFRWE